MHCKIKRILTEHDGISSSKIGIITSKLSNVKQIAEGFNSAIDNKYEVILANEKAGVGLNLQNGTQAIHHLTVGWTPDSLTQRNGRAARQDNKIVRINIYQYDADGTFDSIRRDIVESKARWIDTLTSKDGAEEIEINAGLSREESEAMINAIGDKNALDTFAQNKQELEKQLHIKQAQFDQQTILEIIFRKKESIENNKSAMRLFAEKLFAIKEDITALNKVTLTIDILPRLKSGILT